MKNSLQNIIQDCKEIGPEGFCVGHEMLWEIVIEQREFQTKPIAQQIETVRVLKSKVKNDIISLWENCR